MTTEDEVTRSSDPRLVAARVFIGNLPSDKTSQEEIKGHFQKYGPILGVSIFKGFAFVQYEELADAQSAVTGEHRSVFKGSKLDIRLASEGRKKRDVDSRDTRRGPSPPRHSSSPSRRLPSPLRRPPSAEMYRDSKTEPRPPYGVAFDRRGDPLDPFYRRPVSMSEISSHPFSSALNPAVVGSPYMVGPNQIPAVSGYMQGAQGIGSSAFSSSNLQQTFPHAGGPIHPAEQRLEPHMSQEVSAPPIKRTDVGLERPFDCAILVADKNNRSYAEMVERRLLELNLTVDLLYLVVKPEAVSKIVELFSQRGLLYMIIIQKQHEDHKSVTVNILHGSPQEHRNMPLEDALLMLSRDFNGYLSKLRCGSEQPSLNFLLHLISDGKNLSQGELDRVVQHLQGRKDQLASTSGAAEQQPAQFSTGHPSGSLDDNKERVQAQPTSSAADLQKKILSILGGGSNPSAPVTSTSANIGAQSLISEKPVSLLGAGPATTKIPVLGDVQVSVSSSVPAVSQPGLMGQATAEAAKPQADLQKTLNSLLQNPDALKNIMPKQQQPLLANPGMNLGDDGHNFQDGGGSSVSQPPSIGSYGNGYGGGSYQAMVSTKPKAATPDATAEAQGGIQPMFGGQPSQQRVASARIYGSRGLLDAPKSFDFQN